MEDFKVKKYKRGYAMGTFDMFHIGHLNILKKAKEYCDYLIVGVSTDEDALSKKKATIIPEEERLEIVANIKCVDEAVYQYDTNDKMGAWKKYKFDVIFVGSDWQGTEKWNKIEAELKTVNVDTVYFPYTKGTSSTILKEKLRKIN